MKNDVYLLCVWALLLISCSKPEDNGRTLSLRTEAGDVIHIFKSVACLLESDGSVLVKMVTVEDVERLARITEQFKGESVVFELDHEVPQRLHIREAITGGTLRLSLAGSATPPIFDNAHDAAEYLTEPFKSKRLHERAEGSEGI